MSLLDDLSSAISGAAQAASPSVVGIGARIRGSGVVVGPDRVMTNAHNLRGEEVTVSFADGRSLRGRVAGTDLDGDLAVIDVATEGAPALAWAEGGVIVGSVVFGLAATSGGPARVTVGTVSAVARAFRGPGGRRISGSLEHTAPLAPGSSGSPLVDGGGKLVGLNTNRLANGFYLALPADEALRQRVAALQRGESAERPRLGIGIAPSWVARRMRRAVGLAEHDGVLVREVEDGSPAAAAGIAEGDLIVDAGGRPIREPDDVYDALGAVGAATSLTLRIVRGAEERSIEVDFGGAAGGAGGAVH